MKSRDEFDDDGDRTLSLEWGEGRALRASLVEGRVMPTLWTRDGHLNFGTLDADDAQALAVFWADVAAGLREGGGSGG